MATDTTNSRQNLPETIAGAIRKRIFKGIFQPEDRLPSETSLAEEFETNRTTVREALRILGAEGLIDSGQGRPSTVRDWRDHATIAALPDLLEVSELDASFLRTIESFFELRRNFLVRAITEAIENGTEDEFNAIAEAADTLQQARSQGSQAVSTADAEFYGAIVHATHNLIFRLSFNTYTATLARFVNQSAGLVTFSDGYFVRLADAAEALAQRDADLARERLNEHLTITDREILVMLRMLVEAG